MATTTTHFALTKPAVNNAIDADLWGGEINTDMDTIDTQLFLCALLAAAQTFSGAQKVSATALTSSGASIATDFSLNNNFTHTLTEITTLANPTNIIAGQSGCIQFTQHASSPKTLAYGTYFKFPGGTVPTLTATNSACDTLYYSVRSSTFIECSLVKGFA